MVRSLSTIEPGDEIRHEYTPFKPSESSDITDCDQCGGDLCFGSSNSKRQPQKCKICGLVVHDNCRQIVFAECAIAGSIRLSYRFYQETLLPYGAYSELLQLVSFLNTEEKEEKGEEEITKKCTSFKLDY